MPIESNTSKKISKKTLFIIAGAIVLVIVMLGVYAYSKSVNNTIPVATDMKNQNKDAMSPAAIPNPIQPSETKPVEPATPQVNTPTSTQATTTAEPKPAKTPAPTTATDKPKNTAPIQPEPKNTTNSTPTNTPTKPSGPINTPTVPLNEDRGAFDF